MNNRLKRSLLFIPMFVIVTAATWPLDGAWPVVLFLLGLAIPATILIRRFPAEPLRIGVAPRGPDEPVRRRVIGGVFARHWSTRTWILVYAAIAGSLIPNLFTENGWAKLIGTVSALGAAWVVADWIGPAGPTSH